MKSSPPLLTPGRILAFGLVFTVAVALPSILGGWYLDADDWLIIRMGRTVAAAPTVDHFTRFWTDEPTWRPLLTARAGLESALFGDAITPRLLVNLALHLACALLVFLTARAWLGHPVAAAWAAVLFAAHPMHAESLAWFHSGFEGITVTLPILAALYLYATRRPLWATLIAFQIALLTRENALCVPFVIAAAAFSRAPTATRFSRAFIDSAPFWALLVANVGLRFIAVTLLPDRGPVGSFHIAEYPIAALTTTLFHPWVPIHPALPWRLFWWGVFAAVPFGLAYTQRGMDTRELKTGAVLFCLFAIPFLPQFHDATRFLSAQPGGYEQRWYYFHLPLAAFALWPAYVLTLRDYNRTRWSTLALAALMGLYLTAFSANARWYRDLADIPRQVLTTVDAAIEQRPHGIGFVITEGLDSAELADQVLLNLTVIRPITAQRRLRTYHVRLEGNETQVDQATITPDAQIQWRPIMHLPPNVLWYVFNAKTHTFTPIEAIDLPVEQSVLALCCREPH